jgi:hypothetical protein
MNCKYFEDLLIQCIYNELDIKEIPVLEDHLKICEKCRAKLKDIEQTKVFSKMLSKSIPYDKNQEESIRCILEEITSSRSLPGVVKNKEVIAQRNKLIYNAFRIVTNLAATFFIGLFLFQQFAIKKDLEDLRSKMNSESRSIQVKDLHLNRTKIINLSEDQIEVLIEEYDELLKENGTILFYLRTNYPEIYREIQRKIFNGNAQHNL